MSTSSFQATWFAGAIAQHLRKYSTAREGFFIPVEPLQTTG
jgi:hypothetical protein